MYEDEIPKHRADKKYKKKPTVVEARYIHKDKFWRELFNHGNWFKWKSYRDEKTALEAKQSLERKHNHLQFRIKY